LHQQAAGIKQGLELVTDGAGDGGRQRTQRQAGHDATDSSRTVVAQQLRQLRGISLYDPQLWKTPAQVVDQRRRTLDHHQFPRRYAVLEQRGGDRAGSSAQFHHQSVRSSGTREAMQLASAGALGQAAPMARGLAQISRVNNASDAAPGFCINTFTKRFIPYLVVKSREPLIDWKVACCAMATGASSRRKTPAYR
jgi:hypothetical protein